MPKATLSYDLNDMDDKAAFELANSADRLNSVLWDISQNLFRPARKHGYSTIVNSGELNELIKDPKVARAIELLEEEFHALLNEADVHPA